MTEKQISHDRQQLINKNQEIERRQNFTDKEAAAYLRISQVTLWRERKKGKISFRRAASKIIYTQADLDNYLQSTKRDAFACAA
ncbi:MAG: helix-turn-helix domain-containing protein [Acidobacteria bacterium]|nr:helix-turn-helix domain-containing protein [Acidobacteriota bacterium]MCA1638783.1 helix-turn-helix domain-containing protein [Acidobacteriota bacterium]